MDDHPEKLNQQESGNERRESENTTNIAIGACLRNQDVLRTYRGLGRPHSSADLVPRLLLAPVRPRARPTAVGQDDARRGRHFRRGQDRRGRVRRFMCVRGNPFEARIAGDC